MKSRSTGKVLLSVLVVFLAAGTVLAEEIPNWVVPPYPSPGQLGKLVDATPPRAFIGLPPCRIVDTRGNAAPIQGGMFTGGSDVRTYTLPPICGIPAGVDAVSLNFTAVGPAAAGFLVSWPAGGVVPPVSILNFVAGQTVANAAIVPTSGAGAITVNVSAATHLLVDINGYFSDILGTPGNFFEIHNNSLGFSILASNSSTTCGGPCGVRADILSTAGAQAISGFANGATGANYGVYGQTSSVNTSSAGVLGVVVPTSPAIFQPAVRGTNNGTGGFGVGVYGSHAGSGFGVYGTAGAGGWGVSGQVFSTTAGTTAVRGQAFGASGVVYGVWGSNASTSDCAAGVRGVAGTEFPCAHGDTAGVLGQNSALWGVLGISNNASARGVQGTRVAGGVAVTGGVLGYIGTSGVHSFNDVTAGGAKPFVVPYEGDPTKQIVYIATEADEAITSTRGRAALQRGLATIKVPEHFLKVTEPEGWSVQLTPIGDMATLAVVRIDPDHGEIVVRGSRSVDVFYRVEGVRRGYSDFKPVQDNVYFVPQSATAKMDPWPERTRRILVENGIYNADGTPNLETAERLGWKKVWDEQEAAAKAAAAKAKDTEGQKQE